MLEGEILYRSGEFDAAFAKLEEGVALEDALAIIRMCARRSPVGNARSVKTTWLWHGRVGGPDNGLPGILAERGLDWGARPDHSLLHRNPGRARPGLKGFQAVSQDP
mgnify:CR=1 FL=1